MKYGYLFLLVIISFCISAAETKKGTPEEPGTNEKLVKARTPSAMVVGAQQDPSRGILRELDQDLNTLTRLCDKEKTIEEKLALMHTAFQNMQKTAQAHLSKTDLSDPDGELLENVALNIPPKGIYYTHAALNPQSVKDADIVNTFIRDYSRFHGLQDNTKPENFPDEWARKIYAGLICLNRQINKQ